MNFQQLRSVREAVKCNFNLTEVAHLLFTSQPGVSRQIRELEDELGIDIFIRSGKRLTGLTPPGKTLLPIVERLLLDCENLKRVGADFSAKLEGKISVAATHSQARYALPHAVRDFRLLFPQVTFHLHQGSPKQVAEMLLSGEADIGVATEALNQYPQLVTIPCYRWTHSIIVPPHHPLLEVEGQVTLEQLVKYPIITYELGYTGRSHIDDAFAKVGLQPNVVLTAMDADVITIETSRSDMELLRGFGEFHYPNEIGPGVYDIHSPRVPGQDEIVRLIRKAAQVIPPENLWVNPDCGLKTRGWEETEAALAVMVKATQVLRDELQAENRSEKTAA